MSSAVHSLKFRVMLSAALMILLILPLVGITLVDAFNQHMQRTARDELGAHLYGVLAVAEVEKGELVMPAALLENRFNLIQSGLYAVITQDRKPVWQSDSLLGLELPPLPKPDTGSRNFARVNIKGQPHFVESYGVSFVTNKGKDAPYTVHIIKDMAEINASSAEFAEQMRNWLLVMTVVLMVISGSWLWWTLRPLQRFRQELNDVEQGRSDELSTDYPAELHSVASQLNRLLQTEQNQRKRFRNALSDLAHSLKTPLAVLQSEQNLPVSAQEQIQAISQSISRQLKRAQSAGESAWHLGTELSPVADKLSRTLAKLYPNIEFNQAVTPELRFRGDTADLMEMLGNLLDNACKAANSKVMIYAVKAGDSMSISIEDDGPGVPPEKAGELVQRGKRADSYDSGHGLGLAIVQDLADSYRARLVIDRSPSLGGARFTLKFSGD
ncbi:ATP-binding protein [Shewanella submarina]|uniref:histidine kinase n=1 Tax=Shewanella submarina TaxID=2016376 RepID=A0ABV7GJQ3_9GAMM|nr:ATP-binding protein [Shewanella submarina]MCL1036312.1 ATP-binding protein [Shewanella submarina]